ncbi:MAG TPA: ATP-dependent RecD-like DNA helicase [Desulfobacteraceae bacterium]|nr:ATP-dependent RecD-like DNA helicase [Desulfobacteraceae bacterium]
MLVDLQGQIERVTYTNDENGYTIAKVRIYGRRDLVTIVGNLMSPTPGEIIRMRGEWTNHPRYGEQFKIVRYKSMVPASVYGIEKYLGSGLIKGIGPVMAKRIVKVFGKDTFEIIENEIEKLSDVHGIGKKRIGMIKKAWDEQKEIREVMVFLQSHGVSSGYATKIFKQYGDCSIEVVKENPYRLAMDIFGIGFVTADRIAEKLGFPRDSELRAEAGILYVLNQFSEEGHVYYPHDPLIDKCAEVLDIEKEIVKTALRSISAQKKVVIEDINQEAGGKAVYPAKYHVSETSAAARIKTLSEGLKSIRSVNSEKAVQWVQGRLSINLAEKQVEAVKKAIENKFMVITGGPGTGKTTIINAILKIFSVLKIRVLLAAPTGRAAKKMTEATGYMAKTIHRLLEYSIQKGGFQKNEEHPLDCDLLILDETSMIDIILMHHLLKAVPLHATVILVGDVNQLPSVGAGNVLKDIIGSGAVPVVELKEIFRQAKESLIIVNAHRINNGIVPPLKSSREKLEDFYFIEQEDPEEVLKTILDLVRRRIPSRFDFDPIEDIQVLSPMHKGTVGAMRLNNELQKELNPSGCELTRGGRAFRVMDKVMQVRNNYDKEVFNGDIGRITRIDPETQEVLISFEGREVSYEYMDLDELILAYAVSVHKSQGSEYPAVIIPLLPQHYVLLQRNLLYTAVTRGRKLVIIVGSKKALGIAVKNNRTEKRYTYLKNRLISPTQAPSMGSL